MDRDWKTFYRTESKNYHNIRYGSGYGQVFAALHQTLMKETLEKCSMRHKLLDIATGTGHNLDTMKHYGKIVVACDLSMEMLEICKKRVNDKKDIKYLRVDALSLPFPDNTFDVVASSRFLHLLPTENQQMALNEFVRVLKKDGILIVDFYNRYHWFLLALPIALFRRLKNKRPTGDTHNTATEIVNSIHKSGVNIESMKGLGSYFLVAFFFLSKKCLIKIGEVFRCYPMRLMAEQIMVVARKI